MVSSPGPKLLVLPGTTSVTLRPLAIVFESEVKATTPLPRTSKTEVGETMREYTHNDITV